MTINLLRIINVYKYIFICMYIDKDIVKAKNTCHVKNLWKIQKNALIDQVKYCVASKVLPWRISCLDINERAVCYKAVPLL